MGFYWNIAALTEVVQTKHGGEGVTRTLGNWAPKKKTLGFSLSTRIENYWKRIIPFIKIKEKKDMGPVTEMVMSKSRSVNQ